MRKTMLSCSLILLLSACSSRVNDETHIGITEHYYRPMNTVNYTKEQYYAPIPSECIRKDDILDIRLDSFGLSKDVDGFFEDVSDGSLFTPDLKDRNEVAVFVTIKEISKDTDNNVGLDKRLVFTSSSLKSGVKANVINKLIYSHVYNGNDLEFSIEVLELDLEQGGALIQMLEDISKFATNTLAINTVVSSDMLNTIGKNISSKYFKNDVVSRLSMQLVPCGSYGVEQLYLQQGQIAFVRREQVGFKANRFKKLAWDKSEYRPVSLVDKNVGADKYPSYVAFSVLKRNPSLGSDKYIATDINISKEDALDKELQYYTEQNVSHSRVSEALGKKVEELTKAKSDASN
jgi:hypothetical protein